MTLTTSHIVALSSLMDDYESAHTAALDGVSDAATFDLFVTLHALGLTRAYVYDAECRRYVQSGISGIEETWFYSGNLPQAREVLGIAAAPSNADRPDGP